MTDLLPSWNERAAKRSIEQFVTAAATEGEGVIKPADRIAVFDNDGTLWIEQPLPIQLDFIFPALAKAARGDSSLAQQEPYKAILTRDQSFFEAVARSYRMRSGRSRRRSPGPGWAPRPNSSRPRLPRTCRR